jgi:hypothetical protein
MVRRRLFLSAGLPAEQRGRFNIRGGRRSALTGIAEEPVPAARGVPHA